MLGLDSYVKLYSNFNSTITDDYGGKTLTGNGSASISTSVKKFGAGSLLLASATSDFISCTDDSDFDVGNGDFTFDLQIRFVSLPSSSNRMCLFSSWNDTTNEGYRLNIYNNGGTYELEWSYTTDGSTEKKHGAYFNFVVDTFYHIAVCRDTINVGLFVDGDNIGNYKCGTDTIYNSSEDFKIGAYNTTETSFFNGYIDEFRFSKGIARYTVKSFDPPTSAITPTTNDVLLLHCDGSDDSTTFTDSSSSAHTITANGNAKIKTSLTTVDSFKFGSGSAYFDGTNDYIRCLDSDDFNFGSGDFTIDCWVKPESLSGYMAIISQRADITIDHGWGFYLYGTTQIRWTMTYNGTTQVLVTFTLPATMQLDIWQHIAIVRNGTNLDCYLDGVQCSSTYNISTNTIFDSYQPLKIGCADTGIVSDYNGYIDELRVSKGIARWTTGFTPPSSAYTTDSYTKLLLHFDSTDQSQVFIDDSDATVTGNYKFSTGSLALDSNTTDYLSISDSDDWNFGSGDFTIDFWFYANTFSPKNQAFVNQRDAYGTQHNFGIYTEYSQLLVTYSTNGSTGNYKIFTGGSLSVKTWYHVALVRESTNLKLYVNGTLYSTAWSIGAVTLHNSTADLRIGVSDNTFILPLNGYIDELRISKGIARWTSNFTPPSSAYTSDSYTVLLLHFSESRGSQDIADSGETGHTITAHNNAQVDADSTGHVLFGINNTKIVAIEGTTVNPVIGTGMLYVDGSGDYLSSSDSSDWDYSNNSFVEEMYLFLISYNSNPNSLCALVNQRVTSTSNERSITYVKPDGILFGYTTTGSGETLFSFDFDFELNTWYHVVLQRNSNILELYIDGYLIETFSITDTFYNSTTVLKIGDATGNSGDYPLRGLLDEIRISNGSTRYTATSFTPPADEYEEVDITPPSVSSLSPANNSIEISLNTNLVITFDENVTAVAGKYITLKLYLDDSVIETIEATNGKITISGAEVTINPDTILSELTKYYVSIEEGAFEDVESNGCEDLTSKTLWSFTAEQYNFSDVVIEVGGVDYTNNADMKSIKIVNLDNFSNSASLRIVMNTNDIKMGMELIIRNTVTSEILFGGLIHDPNKILLSSNFMIIEIYAEGYKQIFGRRTFIVNSQNTLAGTIADGIFTDFIAVGSSTSEELTEGNIENGATIENYVKSAETGLKIFNDLADASGFKWWVTNEKEFYFQEAPSYIDNTSTKKLTPDKTDPLYINCVDTPIFSEDSSQFKTRQFVIGKTLDDSVILGSYADTTAETEMATRYGSGVFGSVITNEDISTVSEANALAQTEVETYVNPATITFKTYDKINVLELIKVNIPILGISNETYKVTQVTKTILPTFQILSEIVIEKYVADTKQKRVWTDEFGTMLKSNTSQKQKEITYDEISGGASITNVAPDTRTLIMTVDIDKGLHTFYSIIGTCAGAATITVTIAIDTVTKKVFTWDEPAGNFSKTLAFPIRTITESKSSASITAVTSTTATLTIAGTDLTFWANTN